MMTSVFEDRRTKILAYTLDVPRCTAAGLACGLWAYAESIESDGLLSYSHAYEMLAHVGWKHPDGAGIIDALEKSGWITPVPDHPFDVVEGFKGFRLADWDQIQSDRLKERLRKRNQRARDPSQERAPPAGTCPTEDGEPKEVVPSAPPEQKDPSQQREEGGKGVDGISGNCAQGGFLYGAEEAEPPMEPPARQSKKYRAPPLVIEDIDLPPELDTYEVHAALVEWLDHRRRKRKPYRDKKHVSHTLAEYVNQSPEAFVAAVNHSISCDYQGLYPAGHKRPDANQTRRQLAANAFDQVEKELGQ